MIRQQEKKQPMEIRTAYAFGKTGAASFAVTEKTVREELQKEGR